MRILRYFKNQIGEDAIQEILQQMFSEDGPPTAMQTALVNLVNKDIQRSTIEYIPLLV